MADDSISRVRSTASAQIVSRDARRERGGDSKMTPIPALEPVIRSGSSPEEDIGFSALDPQISGILALLSCETWKWSVLAAAVRQVLRK